MHNIITDLSKQPKAYVEQLKSELYLSEYENYIFDLCLKGKSAIYIAGVYGLSERTIYRIKKSITIKLQNLLE